MKKTFAIFCLVLILNFTFGFAEEFEDADQSLTPSQGVPTTAGIAAGLSQSIEDIVGTSYVKGFWLFDGYNPQYDAPAIPAYSGTGTVINVGIGDDIETALAAATAGDTIQLAAGTYTITADIDIAQAINVVGAGVGVTTIYTTTDSVSVFNITSDDVRVSDLSISMDTLAVATGIRCSGGDAQDRVFENINIDITNATNGAIGFFSDDGGSAILKNIILNVMSADNSVSGIFIKNDVTATINGEVVCINCVSTCDSNGSTGSKAFHVYNSNDAQSITLNLYNCYGSGATGGTSDCGLICDSFGTNNAIANAYNCTFSGADADVIQTGTNTLTLYNTTLANRTTSGTITYGGTATTITDLSGNSHDITLGSNSASLSPSYAGYAPSLTMAGTVATSWSAADSDDFTPGAGGFTVVTLVNPTSMSDMNIGKTGATGTEWEMGEASGDFLWAISSVDMSSYVGASIATASVDYAGGWHTLIGTADGNTNAATLVLYGDGVPLATSAIAVGGAFTVTNTTEAIANYFVATTAYSSAKYSIVLVIARELTAPEVEYISDLLLQYAGVS